MKSRRVPGHMADEVPEGSGGFRCRWLMKSRRVPGHMADEVPEGSGGFRCRWLMKSRRVPGHMADEVPEGSGGFRCRWLMRFPRVLGQIAKSLPRSSKLLGITHEFISRHTVVLVQEKTSVEQFFQGENDAKIIEAGDLNLHLLI